MSKLRYTPKFNLEAVKQVTESAAAGYWWALRVTQFPKAQEAHSPQALRLFAPAASLRYPLWPPAAAQADPGTLQNARPGTMRAHLAPHVGAPCATNHTNVLAL